MIDGPKLYEQSLRCLLILNSVKCASSNRILCLDFAASRPLTFDYGDGDLIVDGSYLHQAFLCDMSRIDDALRIQILLGNVKPEYRMDGTMYALTDDGYVFVQLLNDDFYFQYTHNAELICQKYGNKSDDELIKIMMGVKS